MDSSRDLGLFPLDLVLLPGERIPLHLFEARYRQLYADCVLDDHPFVVVRTTEAGPEPIGCAARFDELIQRLDDGRLNVVVLGVEPVEILEETEGNLYFSATVRSLIDDETVAPDPVIAADVVTRFRALAEKVTGTPRDPEVDDGVPLSYAVAGAVEIPPDTKQQILASRDENQRLLLVARALEVAAGSIERASVAAERASTNGKVSH